jgi:hypothetical protein
MTNQRWRLVLGAGAALCSFLLVQQAIQDYQWAMVVIGGVNVVLAFLKAPEDATE